jgi:hypothetical protein
MKLWLWILQRAPTVAPRWISTNVPIRLPTPMRQPYRLLNACTITPAPNSTSSIRRNGASLETVSGIASPA